MAGEPDVVQTFAYVPVVGTDVLSTGETLGWYTPGQGSIAMDLTGGMGVLDNPNFSSIQTGIYPTTEIANRSYYVGFTASPAPEPSYAVALGIGLVAIGLFRRTTKAA